jgi:tetrahydromethanopterin S-methyltransferase subunit C
MDEVKDYLLNRRITLFYGITFLFIFLAAVISEILSLVFDEGLLSPPIVGFHIIAFIGYVLTLRYVIKKQPIIEEKNRETIKKDLKRDGS